MNEAPRRTKAYLVIMSNKDPIRIDEEELQKIVEGSARGGLVVVKQGVVNPSYIVDIQLDKERMREWHDRCQYGFGQGEEASRLGIEPLSHIYTQGAPLAVLLEKKQVELEALLPKQPPRLGAGKGEGSM